MNMNVGHAGMAANASGVNKNSALFLLMGLVAVALVLAPDSVHAGTGGTAFDDVWTTLKDWTQGTLGRIVAGAMILVCYNKIDLK
ncbi:conjugal transfer protein TraA [Aeromonas hydrophila NJ-35]|nr:conjugal transfer protein TraA [Aeromonas hydrophila NJ-35]